jgi:hypothetical protein
VLASREGREFVYILGKPGGFFRQRNKSVLNGRGLRVETHDLLGYRKFVNRRSFQRDAQGRVENWMETTRENHLCSMCRWKLPAHYLVEILLSACDFSEFLIMSHSGIYNFRTQIVLFAMNKINANGFARGNQSIHNPVGRRERSFSGKRTEIHTSQTSTLK